MNVVALALAVPVALVSFFPSTQDDVRAKLSELKKALAEHEGDVAQLSKTYTEIAELNRSTDDPAAQVTKLLGQGLEEDDFTLRATVLQELLRGQEPAEAVKAVLAGLKKNDSDWKEIDRAVSAMNANRGKSRQKNIPMEEVRRLTQGASFFPWYFEALGHVPDAKVEKELLSRMRKAVGTFPGVFCVGLAKGCLANGSEDAVGALATYADQLGRALDKDKVKERYPRGDDKSFRMMDMWVAIYSEPRDLTLEQIASATEEFATQNGLSAPPNPLKRDGKAWTAWFKENLDKLGAGAGKLDTVLTVEIPEPPKAENGSPFGGRTGDR